MSEGETYERVLCVKSEVFVFKIPPRPSNRGYRAAEWNLETPDWVGRMRVVSYGERLFIKLEEKLSGELFAKCPVDTYPGAAIESVTDSSRYFVIQIKDDNNRSAFIGIGFADRSDSFDLNVAIQDHFKHLKQEKEMKEAADRFDPGPKLDLGFKQGQMITLNIGNKKSEGKPRHRATAGAGTTPGLLPPPPGGVKLPPPPGRAPVIGGVSGGITPNLQQQQQSAETGDNQSAGPISLQSIPQQQTQMSAPIPDLIPSFEPQGGASVTSSVPSSSSSYQPQPTGSSNLDLLLDIGAGSTPSPQSQQQNSSGAAVADLLADFGPSSSQQQPPASSQQANSANIGADSAAWIQF